MRYPVPWLVHGIGWDYSTWGEQRYIRRHALRWTTDGPYGLRCAESVLEQGVLSPTAGRTRRYPGGSPQ